MKCGFPVSCAGPRSTALNDAAEQLIAAGIPVVTSAGNKVGAWLAGCGCLHVPVGAHPVMPVMPELFSLNISWPQFKHTSV